MGHPKKYNVALRGVVRERAGVEHSLGFGQWKRWVSFSGSERTALASSAPTSRSSTEIPNPDSTPSSTAEMDGMGCVGWNSSGSEREATAKGGAKVKVAGEGGAEVKMALAFGYGQWLTSVQVARLHR